MTIKKLLGEKATAQEIIVQGVDSLLFNLAKAGYLVNNDEVITETIADIYSELVQAEKDIKKNFPRDWTR